MAKVVRATVNKSLTVVGTVEPVSDASVAFQVGGKVATVTATVGQNVTAGQSLATLDTTALSETVSSAQSTFSSAEAKLTQDENSQTGSTSPSTTTTTTPSHSTSTGPGNGGTNTGTNTATITQDQNTLTTDEATTNADQQQEAADLAQATAACGAGAGSGGPPPSTSTTTSTSTSTTTSTTAPSSNTSACTAALQKVSSDQQQVSTDEATVAKDESALAKALGDTSSPSPTGAGGTGGTGTPTGTSGAGGQGSHALSAASSGTPSSGNSNPSGSSSPSGSSGAGSNGSGAASDTPQQIAEDQAAIDTAQANLIEAQQALNGAQLTSPINGTIVSIGLAVGDTVSAGSSTAVIVIIGTHSFEVSATLTSSQVAAVKVGATASVSVDGLTTTTNGTISQVGPVQSTSSGYTYPVVVSLPSSVQGLFAGSSANVTIATGQVSDVVAVPTSAVITQGSRSYVEMLDNGALTNKTVHLGMVGGVYTEVLSGLSVGQSVVLADLSQAVPSSNTATLGGLGGGGFFNGGAVNFRRVDGGGGIGPGQSVSIGG
jgi:HlyD family secretion protein